jgi:hypothetical protein
MKVGKIGINRKDASRHLFLYFSVAVDFELKLVKTGVIGF